MGLQEIMKEKDFIVVGDTLNRDKYAYKIKEALQEHGYRVQCVGKELPSLNEVTGDPGVVDLCIHPSKGIRYLKEWNKVPKAVLVQPGAESREIFAFLEEKQIPYMQGCALVGLRLYPNCMGSNE